MYMILFLLNCSVTQCHGIVLAKLYEYIPVRAHIQMYIHTNIHLNVRNIPHFSPFFFFSCEFFLSLCESFISIWSIAYMCIFIQCDVVCHSIRFNIIYTEIYICLIVFLFVLNDMECCLLENVHYHSVNRFALLEYEYNNMTKRTHTYMQRHKYSLIIRKRR